MRGGGGGTEKNVRTGLSVGVTHFDMEVPPPVLFGHCRNSAPPAQDNDLPIGMLPGAGPGGGEPKERARGDRGGAREGGGLVGRRKGLLGEGLRGAGQAWREPSLC